MPLKKRRKAAKDRKESLIRVLVTGEQRKALSAAADAAGLSLSTWVRAEALRAAKGRGEAGGGH